MYNTSFDSTTKRKKSSQNRLSGTSQLRNSTSLYEKYPLVMLCPNKEIICNSSGKQRKKIIPHNPHKQAEVFITKSSTLNKPAAKLSNLKDEAYSNWELLKSKKLKKNTSHLHPSVPVTASVLENDSKDHFKEVASQVPSTETREEIKAFPHLPSPTRTKLRMAPSIDLPHFTVGSQECEVTNSKKAKLSSNPRTSSRSNKGVNHKYLIDSPSMKSGFVNVREAVFPTEQSELNSDNYILARKAELVSRLLKSTKKIEKRKQEKKRAEQLNVVRKSNQPQKHHSSHMKNSTSRSPPTTEGIGNNCHRIKYVSYNANSHSKITLSPKLRSPTKLESPYSTLHFSLDVGSLTPLSKTTSSQECMPECMESAGGDGNNSDAVELSSISKNTDLSATDVDQQSLTSDSESETAENCSHTQIETGMVGVYLEASYPQLPPLCSLCCSVGDHELIFCCICCDSYHKFCIGMESEFEAVSDWVCYSCISCSVCGRGRDLETINQCFKCHTYYHMGCLGIHPFPHSDTNSGNWPCPKCLVCTDCGTERPERFPRRISPGKLFCKRCDKLIKKGNFCPLCCKVYGDNDWECQMIECDSCKSWVHSSCESLLDEDYNLLGELPPTLPYICSICHGASGKSTELAPWRKALNENRHLRLQIILTELQSLYACKMFMDSLNGSTNGMKSLHTTFLAILQRVESSGYCSLEEFCLDWLNSLHPIFKLMDRKSVLYRHAFSVQTSLIKMMCKEFPWFVIPKIGCSVEKIPPKQKSPATPSPSFVGVSSTQFFNPLSDKYLAFTFDHSYSKFKNAFTSDLSAGSKSRRVLLSSQDQHRPTDRRQCILCKNIGDGTGEREGRLLPCGINEWVHTNCAIWSSDVYTKVSCLKNVNAAILTGLKTCCSVCGLLGATIGCYDRSCMQSVHYLCAWRSKWSFLKNRKVFCPEHGRKFPSQLMCDEKDFLVDEFLFVESSSASQNQRLQNMAKLTGSRKLNIVSGCVRVYSLGSIIPSSDSEEALYPISFRSSRLFWSVSDPTRLSSYTCFVKEYTSEQPICHPDVNHTISHSNDIALNNSKDVRNRDSFFQDVTNDRISPQMTAVIHESIISAPLSPVPMNSLTSSQIIPLGISNSGNKISDSPVKVRRSSDLSLGSEICSIEPLTAEGFFEQTFPYLKQTDYPVTISQKPINYSKLSSNKLFPLINEDYFLNQHRSRFNENVDEYPDKPHHQQKPATPATQHTSKLKFIIANSDGFTAQSDSLQGAWDIVIQELVLSRDANCLPPLSFHTTCPQDMFGFTLHCITQELERLEDTEKCSKYQFKFHPPRSREDWNDLDQVYENPLGAARCISYKPKSSYGMFNFFFSKHRCPPPKLDKARLAHILNEEEQLFDSHYHTPHLLEAGTLPFLRYRQMIRNLPHTVKVFRSRIHGLGLFALRDIDSGDMIIEYAGLVIRPLMCDIKEAYYESKGIGCYMFKIDENQVVDATMSGNASRFINHSCQPNCASKIAVIEGKKKILIFARRRVIVGEELTYDYKFPLEENKIICMCGSKKCRKYLN